MSKTLALAANGAFVTAHILRRPRRINLRHKRAKVSHLLTTVSTRTVEEEWIYYGRFSRCAMLERRRVATTPSSRWLAKEDVQMFSKLQQEILFEAASIQFENRKRLATKRRQRQRRSFATCSIFRRKRRHREAFEASDIFMEMGYEPWPFKEEEEEEEEEEISLGY